MAGGETRLEPISVTVNSVPDIVVDAGLSELEPVVVMAVVVEQAWNGVSNASTLGTTPPAASSNRKWSASSGGW